MKNPLERLILQEHILPELNKEGCEELIQKV